jgi:hypothetical protein
MVQITFSIGLREQFGCQVTDKRHDNHNTHITSYYIMGIEHTKFSDRNSDPLERRHPKEDIIKTSNEAYSIEELE